MANNFRGPTFDALALIRPNSNGAGLAFISATNRWSVLFDDTTAESAVTPSFPMPDAYTGSGTLYADIEFALVSATSGGIAVEVSVEAITSGDAVDTDASESFDTSNVGTDTSLPATAGYMKVLSIALSNKDSVAVGDMVRLKIARVPSNGSDTATGDLRVYSVTLREAA